MQATITINNLHYAIVTNNNSTQYTHNTPKRIEGVSELSINPNPDTDSIKTNKPQMRRPALLGLIEVDFTSIGLTLEQKAELTGHTLDSNGILRYNINDKSPQVAIGFEVEKPNGSKQYVWLPVGRVKENVKEFATKGDGYEIKVPKLVMFFRRTAKTNEWKLVLDEDSSNFNQSTADDWYTSIPI